MTIRIAAAFLKGVLVMTVLAVIVNLIPYVIAAVIAVRFTVKQKKTKCKVNWNFAPLALASTVLISFSYNIFAKFLGVQENVFSLCVLLLAYFLSDLAFYFLLKPMEYGENFYLGLFLNLASIVILFIRLTITRLFVR